MSRKFTDTELKALNILKDAAENGDSNDKFSLGNFYFVSSYSLKNVDLLEDAESWFKEAAENGEEYTRRFYEKFWHKEKQRIREMIIIEIEEEKNDL